MDSSPLAGLRMTNKVIGYEYVECFDSKELLCLYLVLHSQDCDSLKRVAKNESTFSGK